MEFCKVEQNQHSIYCWYYTTDLRLLESLAAAYAASAATEETKDRGNLFYSFGDLFSLPVWVVSSASAAPVILRERTRGKSVICTVYYNMNTADQWERFDQYLWLFATYAIFVRCCAQWNVNQMTIGQQVSLFNVKSVVRGQCQTPVTLLGVSWQQGHVRLFTHPAGDLLCIRDMWTGLPITAR